MKIKVYILEELETEEDVSFWVTKRVTICKEEALTWNESRGNSFSTFELEIPEEIKAQKDY